MIVPCYKMHAFRYEEPRNSKKNIRSYFLTQLMWSQGERLRSSKNPSVELDQYMMTRSLQDGPLLVTNGGTIPVNGLIHW